MIASCHFLNLPNELLRDILQYLEIPDFTRACATCSRLRTLREGLLLTPSYSDVVNRYVVSALLNNDLPLLSETQPQGHLGRQIFNQRLQITALDLKGGNNIFGSNLAVLLNSFPHVQDLTLRSMVITKSGLLHISKLTQLRNLHLVSCLVNPTTEFHHLSSSSTLQSLKLSNCSGIDLETIQQLAKDILSQVKVTVLTSELFTSTLSVSRTCSQKKITAPPLELIFFRCCPKASDT